MAALQLSESDLFGPRRGSDWNAIAGVRNSLKDAKWRWINVLWPERESEPSLNTTVKCCQRFFDLVKRVSQRLRLVISFYDAIGVRYPLNFPSNSFIGTIARIRPDSSSSREAFGAMRSWAIISLSLGCGCVHDRS